MKKIKLTQGKFALVDDDDFVFLSQWKWCFHVRYARRKHILMHRLIMGLSDPKICIDHKNGNGLDNQRRNLRIASRSQNSMNRKSRKGSRSRFKGVDFRLERNKWRAIICVDKKPKYLGLFDSEIEAAKKYNFFAIKFHKEFARLNLV